MKRPDAAHRERPEKAVSRATWNIVGGASNREFKHNRRGGESRWMGEHHPDSDVSEEDDDETENCLF